MRASISYLIASLVLAGAVMSTSAVAHAEEINPEPSSGGTSNPGSMVTAPKQKFVPLAGIPGITDLPTNGGIGPKLSDLINALYKLAIIVGALYGVVKLTLAGIKYMVSDNFHTKGSAREDIVNVLFGLLILLSAVLILQTIIGNVSLTPGNGQIPKISGDLGGPTNSGTNPNVGNGGTTPIDPARGCGQVGVGSNPVSGGTACDPGQTPVIGPTNVKCVTGSTLPPSYEGQSTYTMLPQGTCGSMGIGPTITGGGTVYGYNKTTPEEIYAQTGLSNADEAKAKYMDQLLEKCRTMTGKQDVKIIERAPTLGGYFVGGTEFVCTST